MYMYIYKPLNIYMSILFIRIFHSKVKSMLVILSNICDAGKQVGGIRLDSSTVILLFFIYCDI